MIPETVKCRYLNAASKQLGDTKSKNRISEVVASLASFSRHLTQKHIFAKARV